MSQAIAITGADFEEQVIKSATPVMLDFWAVWCGPCKLIAPTVDSIATDYTGRIKVGKINVDEEPDLATRYNVSSIPTLLFFKDGKVADSIIGNAPKSAIASKLESLL